MRSGKNGEREREICLVNPLVMVPIGKHSRFLLYKLDCSSVSK